MRVGIGFDTHRFTFGRPLVLAGVKIPFSLGLAGHSDADVVTHALIDALLGSVAAGDIGARFPDSDERYKDISSLKLLAETVKIVGSKGYRIVNIDIMALLEEPRLAEYREEMRQSLADTLRIEVSQISIKATTTEGLGFTGRGEGIAAQSIVLVEDQYN